MFGIKKKRMHSLLIGIVSDHTLRYNREMVSKEYDRQIKDKEDNIKYLNAGIFKWIRYGIEVCVGRSNEKKYTDKLGDVNKAGKSKANKIYNNLSLPKVLAYDKDLSDEIIELKAEKKKLGL